MFKTIIFTVLGISMFIGTNYANSFKNETVTDYKVANHTLWNTLLAKHVDSEGNVDYASFVADKADLEIYLELLNKNTPDDNWSKNEKLAYYINLYNAATVKLILDNYPLKSIKDINSPWDKKWVLIGGKKFSLGSIEHKILRKMDEPRIHFAINCASYSCPKLINTAFLPSTMEEQLEAATVDFINDTTRNKITEDKVQLSNIFKWYKSDFTDNGSLIDYLNKYATSRASNDSKISYLKYDWGLNQAR
ncbi:DUF547 domain-containing protein [Aurantibacter sp.]|uniref:DUF547 domain-containing protein n=1 Tax=Aurantibacter sp. TaxID=2807103 RepID=UPI003264298E